MDIMYIDGDLLLKMFKQGTFELNSNKGLVDSLNVFPVPDGDTGTNMSLTMNAALTEALKTEGVSAEKVAKAISKGSLMGARGNSGVILSQIFRGFSKACEGKEKLSSIDLANAFKQASDTAYKAVMKPVEGTILTVIRKTSDKAMEYTEEEVPVHDLLNILIKTANETLDKTPEYLKVLKQAGVVDAGGKGLNCIIQGFYDAVVGKEAADHELEAHMASQSIGSAQSAQSSFNTEDIKFSYCTEFIVRGGKESNMPLKEKIQTLGDSMVFVEDDDLIKIHVHTNDPGIALQSALEYGELLNIKIENMKEQHSTILDENHPGMGETEVEQEPKPFGFISVAMGGGIAEIFRDLGIDYVIEGGQTMNPSTEDIVKAIDSVSGDAIFILPNNSNIILAAQQAQQIVDRPVYVVPSKSIPQGISAMLAFDPSVDAVENHKEMVGAVSEVKTVQITYSVRDTLFDDKEIKKDDILGVAEGEITAVGRDLHEVTISSLSEVIDDDAEIMTIYYGEDVEKEQAEALAKELEAKYEDLEVEVYSGGQPLYYYICSIE